jgi:transcriptional regulator with XRE-family HTH domain
MDQLNENVIASIIKEGRLAKGYTQQELSDLTGISIRSVQRIENGDVIPREYTLRLLVERLGLTDIPRLTSVRNQDTVAPISRILTHIEQEPAPNALSNKPRRIILSVGIGLFLILGTAAFIVQSPRFPETTFEAFCLWLVIALAYTIILLKLWK